MNISKLAKLLDPCGRFGSGNASVVKALWKRLERAERMLEDARGRRHEVFKIDAGGDPVKAFNQGAELRNLTNEINEIQQDLNWITEELKSCLAFN